MKLRTHFVSFSLAWICLVAGMAIGSSPAARAADELLGAETLLKQLAATTDNPDAKQTNTTPHTQLRADLAAFATNSAALPPTTAAQNWLALADRVFELDSKLNTSAMGRRSEALAFQLLAALPNPAAWSALRQNVENRPVGKGSRAAFELGLRVLVHTLDNDAAARKTDLTALEELSKNSPRDAAWTFRSIFEQLNEALLATSDDPELVLKSLERQLTAGDEDRWRDSIEVPNLVALVGAAKAEEFLRKALVHPKLKLEISAGTATHKLAQELALEMVDQLKVPQWGLVNSLGVIKLYEAFDQKFAAKTNAPAVDLDVPTLGLPEAYHEDYQRQYARLYYLLSLISEDRAKDAVVVAQQLGKDKDISLPPEGLKALEQAGYTAALDDFLHELLTQHPEVPFWHYYANLSAKAGQTERMLTLARTTLARPDLGTSTKTMLQNNLYAALLAADQVEEGVAELRKQITQPPTQRSPRQYYNAMEVSLNPALTLARLGQLTARPDWLEAGIAAAKKNLAEPKESSPYAELEMSAINELAGLLVELGRHAEAEAVLATGYREAIQLSAKQRSGRSSSGSRNHATSLAALALLYHEIGRPTDVITLLDQATDWGTADLAQLNQYSLQRLQLAETFGHGLHRHGLPLQFIAASALAKTGRHTEAQKVLATVLDENPGLDAAYELLLETGGTNVPAQLDALFARDQFEERPLIWKAEWLRRKGDLATAESACRQAISIDPSDGEQGPGNRMRAYAVLAEIRAARGDAKEAEFFRGAVSAIRLSERADRFAAAGLMKRAVAMYEESLTKFADAYCIQSRLAVQLAEMGRHEEAEAHYRKAYELMPESFGRVESHCFGCERAFDGQKAQSLAEKVFSDLAVKTPNKPQVHYLLGYLRDEQERHQEAVTHYQKAVALDPDYLNAWLKIQNLTHHVRLPAAQRDDIGLNILRLDPLSRHSHASLEGISDLRRVWEVVAAGQKLRPTQPKSLYQLTASQAELKKQPGSPTNEILAETEMEFYESMGGYSGRSSAMTPATALRNNTFVQTAARLMSPELLLALNAD
jgi:tetratricopeptide (TPR) repeat protein